jgi:salicylate hydroxylase
VLEPTPLAAQLEQARQDEKKILVVGAGIAGVTVAQLLRGASQHPVLIERSGATADAGYMLGLLPLVDPVIEALGVRDEYLSDSVGFDRYRLRAHTGRKLRTDDFRSVLDRHGSYRGMRRRELLQVIAAHSAAVSYETTVRDLQQGDRTVSATFSSAGDSQQAEFDLVILADGLGSDTRRLVLTPAEVETVDTGWSAWVAWAAPDAERDLGEELWGAGFLVGSYPVSGALGVIAGGPTSELADRRGFLRSIRRQLTEKGTRLERVLAAIEADDDAYCWPMIDCRSKRWAIDRVGLLGDAAAGFLPTAGVGAAMAMESAGVLASVILAADPAGLPAALLAYEVHQRPRVELAQNTSRRLASLTFRRSRLLAVLRDLVAARVSVGTALRPIRKLLADSPLRAGRSAGR